MLLLGEKEKMESNVKRKAEKFEPEVSKLADLVEYDAGSIASRTIIDKKSTAVAVFAFDKFQEIVKHVLPYEVLFYVFEGKAEVTISGRSQTVKAGEMIAFPANKPHAISAKSKFKMLLITIKE
jgi:quercetin dioxygenase-like cupin family protein